MRHAAIAFAFLFAMLFIGYSNAASTVTCALTGVSVPITQAGVCIESAIPLAIIGLLVSFIIVAIAFMLGNVFQISSLKNWYKGELWEAAKTTIIVVIIFAVLIILGAIVLGLSGNNAPVSSLPLSSSGASSAVGQNLNELYSVTLNDYVNPDMVSLNESYYALEGLATGITDLKTTKISDWIPIPIPFVGSLQFGSSAALLSSSVIESNTVLPTFSFIKDIIMVVLIPVYIVLGVLSSAIYSILAAAFVLFIPIGIIFRAFPFTRGLGGSFIAIGIAIALVFPSLLILFNLPIQNYLLPLVFNPNIGYSATTSCDYLTFNFFEDMACGPASLGYTVTEAYLIAAQTENPLYDTAFQDGFNSGVATLFNKQGGSVYPAYNLVSYYAYFDIMQLVLFIFDVVITIVIAGAVAQLLGGKLSLGVGKFKIA
ncbi:hypothetical protein M1583_00755 [Candidatus Marsarchaeota archaeon]|nr:hypothetical protein [Candidatus Marsarchaeota archaeon]